METNNYITVLMLAYPHEVAIVRGHFESERIECITQNESMVQFDPDYFYETNGGVNSGKRLRCETRLR